MPFKNQKCWLKKGIMVMIFRIFLVPRKRCANPYINTTDVIILVTWFGNNLETRNKMRNRYLFSGFIGTILISNFVSYVKVTKELHPWHHHGSHLIWIGVIDGIESEDQIFCLKIYMYYWLQLCQICWGDIRITSMTS